VDPPDGGMPEGRVLVDRGGAKAPFARRLQRRLFRRWFLDLGADPGHAIVLAGTGRSGTTWLAEVLNHDNRYRYLFEPLHPDRGRIGRNLGIRPYLRADAEASPATDGLDAVLRGRVRDPWADQYNRRPLATERLIKEVWANLALGWVAAHDPRTRIVFVLRHPCAVASSQLQTGWDWHAEPEHLLRQRALMADHLGPFARIIRATRDPFDQHIALWCAENLVALRQIASPNAHVVFYEHLVADPGGGTRRLFALLGRPWTSSVLRRVAMPSALSRSGSAILVGEDAATSWVSRVSADQRRRALRILTAFGLSALYSDEPMPGPAPGTPLPVLG
jgi:hypothetical protein